jgi:hypothetical protein
MDFGKNILIFTSNSMVEIGSTAITFLNVLTNKENLYKKIKY